jgi:UPF0716 protein FxsA
VLLKLLLLFILVPLAELILLLKLADATGWELTLLLVVVTGIVGSLLAKTQGWRAYRRIQEELAAGRMPTGPLLDGVMIFLAGALLLTPGLLTDAFGLSLLIPWCRSFYRRRLTQWFKSRFTIRGGPPGGWQSGGGPRSEVIDSYVIDPPRDDGEKHEAENDLS